MLNESIRKTKTKKEQKKLLSEFIVGFYWVFYTSFLLFLPVFLHMCVLSEPQLLTTVTCITILPPYFQPVWMDFLIIPTLSTLESYHLYKMNADY